MRYHTHYFFIIKDYDRRLGDLNSINIDRNVLYDKKLKPITKIIFMIIADLSKFNLTVQYTELIKNSNYARDTIKRALDELIENKYIISSTNNEELKTTIRTKYQDIITKYHTN